MGGVPDRFAAVEVGIHFLFGRAQREAAAVGRVEKLVGHDAVVVGIEAGSQCVVVGKGLGGERRNESRSYALAGHEVDERRIVPLWIVPTVAVERDDDGVILTQHARMAQ